MSEPPEVPGAEPTVSGPAVSPASPARLPSTNGPSAPQPAGLPAGPPESPANPWAAPSGWAAPAQSAWRRLAEPPASGRPTGPEILDVAPAAHRRPRLTLVLAAALLLVVGAVGGLAFDRLTGRTSSGTATGSSFRSRFTGAVPSSGVSPSPGASPGSRAGFGGRGLGDVTVGTIVKVAGADVDVKTAAGTVTVVTSPRTRVTLTTTGTVSRLRPGQQVVVRGSTGSNGKVSADSVSEGATGGFGGRFGGAAGTAGGGTGAGGGGTGAGGAGGR